MSEERKKASVSGSGLSAFISPKFNNNKWQFTLTH